MKIGVGRMAVFTLALATSAAGANNGPAGWSVAWTDADGDCQNTRTEVLIRDTTGLIQWADPRACEVADGRWPSWGLDVELDMATVRVVALVPPANAEQHGASEWTTEKKRHFMNDMENLITLDPVSARSRAGHGPERWIPLKRYWCEYARRWETVKQRYGLGMHEEERAALAHMKTTCPDPAAETVD